MIALTGCTNPAPNDGAVPHALATLEEHSSAVVQGSPQSSREVDGNTMFTFEVTRALTPSRLGLSLKGGASSPDPGDLITVTESGVSSMRVPSIYVIFIAKEGSRYRVVQPPGSIYLVDQAAGDTFHRLSKTGDLPTTLTAIEIGL